MYREDYEIELLTVTQNEVYYKSKCSSKSRSKSRTQSKIWDGAFCENNVNSQIKAFVNNQFLTWTERLKFMSRLSKEATSCINIDLIRSFGTCESLVVANDFHKC